jgi:hypothetical protein
LTVPRGLQREGAALYRRILADVPEGMELDAAELETVKRAAQLADLAAEVQADLRQRGLWVIGSTGREMLNPEVARIAQLNNAITAMLARVKLSPREGTRHLSKRQRDQLKDARRARWPVARA